MAASRSDGRIFTPLTGYPGRMIRVALALFALALGVPAAAQQPPPPAGPSSGALAFQKFLDAAGPACADRPARTCVDLGWRFAAASPREGLVLRDVRNLRQRMGEWVQWRGAELPARERSGIGMGLLLADGLGPERLFAAFDTDGNGRISQRELLQDVKLDTRPLGKILADPAAVDRAGVSRRLGLPPALVDALFR